MFVIVIQVYPSLYTRQIISTLNLFQIVRSALLIQSQWTTSVRMRENTDQNDFEYGHFARCNK